MHLELLADRNLADELRDDETLLRLYLGEHSTSARRIRAYVQEAGVPYIEIPTHGIPPRASYGGRRAIGPEAVEQLIDELRRSTV